jgi:hypothetical protein
LATLADLKRSSSIMGSRGMAKEKRRKKKKKSE